MSANEPIKPGHNLVVYQFGKKGGNDASAAGKKSQETHGPRVGVRNALRRLTSLGLVQGRIPSYDELAAAFGDRELTIGEAVAVRILRDALAGSPKAQKQLVDNVDGPVPKVTIKAEASVADLIAAARKELRDEQASNRQH